VSVSSDVLTLLLDLRSMGLACDATYGAGIIVAAIEDNGRPPQYDDGGEITRRTATATVARSQVPSPVKGESLTVIGTAWAGTWRIVEVGSTDDGSWSLTLQADALTAVRAPGARRLAGGE
jgi:hypothetical protein